MRTGASDSQARGHRGRMHPETRLKRVRKTRLRRIELEGLESRTLLATIPGATATGGLVPLTNLSTVTDNGNTNNPTVAIDPYDSQKLIAVWGRDLSTLSPAPQTTAIVEGAYSADGGANWSRLFNVSSVLTDPTTINSNPSVPYAQVTDPSVGFDSQGNFYVLASQHNAGNTSGTLVLRKFDFTSTAPQFASQNF